jgi:hypothetical protein
MIAIYVFLALLPLCTAALSVRFFVSIHAVHLISAALLDSKLGNLRAREDVARKLPNP